MLDFLKRKNKEKIIAPVTGELMALEGVNDAVFSKKMMGDGFAIVPSDGQVLAPSDGTVTSIFPTKHAIILTTDKGLEILIHLGLDTVELKGEPFLMKISEGERVSAGQPIVEMDIDMIVKRNKEPTTLVVFTNMDKVSRLPEITLKKVVSGDVIGGVTLKTN